MKSWPVFVVQYYETTRKFHNGRRTCTFEELATGAMWFVNDKWVLKVGGSTVGLFPDFLRGLPPRCTYLTTWGRAPNNSYELKNGILTRLVVGKAGEAPGYNYNHARGYPNPRD